ncbi:uncharacterized protein BDW47DRAFT_126899 [Aspergillus candidus]|uniref:Uncharacterized protein n=1 Tax=Aspergillus candidus TaxID=41067 RepID=A0A2I2F807_ASPCN|nr:hypothetical protein BDW47DRAFT_126899 [Aspergillus candidus]PLB36757.1 hypothetical protein BDW47DRAFT_126899 [Aspergillus candidus]
MEGPATKLARANSAGDVHIPADKSDKDARLTADQIKEYMEELRPEQLSEIIAEAAQRYPDVANMVRHRVEQQREQERRRVLNFDSYSRDIWKAINVSCGRMSDKRQSEMALRVIEQIERAVDSVVRQCGEHASPQTRWNGLSVLRKIGKTLAFSCFNMFMHDVQETFQWDTFLEDGMLEILAAMSREEMAAIRRDERPEALWPKLVELDGLRYSHGILEHMGKVLDELNRVGTGEEVSEHEGDGDDSQSTD